VTDGVQALSSARNWCKIASVSPVIRTFWWSTAPGVRYTSFIDWRTRRTVHPMWMNWLLRAALST